MSRIILRYLCSKMKSGIRDCGKRMAPGSVITGSTAGICMWISYPSAGGLQQWQENFFSSGCGVCTGMFCALVGDGRDE